MYVYGNTTVIFYFPKFIFDSIFQYHVGWKHNKYRSVSYTFGSDVIEKFLADNNFQLIVRAHQVKYFKNLQQFFFLNLVFFFQWVDCGGKKNFWIYLIKIAVCMYSQLGCQKTYRLIQLKWNTKCKDGMYYIIQTIYRTCQKQRLVYYNYIVCAGTAHFQYWDIYMFSKWYWLPHIGASNLELRW